jgi:hypothetical protein
MLDELNINKEKTRQIPHEDLWKRKVCELLPLKWSQYVSPNVGNYLPDHTASHPTGQ